MLKFRKMLSELFSESNGINLYFKRLTFKGRLNRKLWEYGFAIHTVKSMMVDGEDYLELTLSYNGCKSIIWLWTDGTSHPSVFTEVRLEDRPFDFITNYIYGL